MKARTQKRQEENKQNKKKGSKQALIKELYQMGCLNTADDINNVVKEMIAGIVGGTLEAEMDDHLGYISNDRSSKIISNSRNGHNTKQLNTSYGKAALNVPRDRAGEFEPTVVEKYRRSINREIENKIIGLYAKGMTTNDIENYNRQLRKATKNKSVFPNDDSLFKMLFLATRDICKKQQTRTKDWSQIYSQLAIYFEDRISEKDSSYNCINPGFLVCKLLQKIYCRYFG